MSQFKYTSWGRTRQPKNIAGTHNVEAGTHPAVVTCRNSAADMNTHTAADAADGKHYKTENQRFLHLTTSGGASVTNVWVYTYASGLWAKLMISGAAVTLGASEHKVIEISGVDKVAFHLGGTVHAACSTF